MILKQREKKTDGMKIENEAAGSGTTPLINLSFKKINSALPFNNNSFN